MDPKMIIIAERTLHRYIKIRTTWTSSIPESILLMWKICMILLECYTSIPRILEWSPDIPIVQMVSNRPSLYNMSRISVEATSIPEASRYLLKKEVYSVGHLHSIISVTMKKYVTKSYRFETIMKLTRSSGAISIVNFEALPSGTSAGLKSISISTLSKEWRYRVSETLYAFSDHFELVPCTLSILTYEGRGQT